ncbi:MAG: AraC family transcriptional regulator [Alphaproteobacteria bacterium]|nr:AraC family transcriptional regulator [Alphaproteobacteria bacterium]
MTPLPTLDEYRAQRLGEGFDEVIERKWEGNAVQAPHTHPFSVRAIVVTGQLCLTVGEENLELRPGDEFELEKNTMHSETYGPQGATYWVARKF